MGFSAPRKASSTTSREITVNSTLPIPISGTSGAASTWLGVGSLAPCFTTGAEVQPATVIQRTKSTGAFIRFAERHRPATPGIGYCRRAGHLTGVGSGVWFARLFIFIIEREQLT